jgi:transcriptional regulator with AAA-type ATPase domain
METSKSDTHYRLLVLGDGSVRTVPLQGTRWLVGRATDCQVPVRDPTVSRRHLLLSRDGDQFHIQDLGGSNPILLDGKPVKSGVLSPGQTLAIGMTRLILERRTRAAPLATSPHPTVVLSREVADDEAAGDATPDSFATTASRVLNRIEWTFADLGDLHHAAEPLLDLALNLTGHRRGWIGRFTTLGSIEMLATLDASGHQRDPEVPETVLEEARRIARPHLLSTQEGAGATRRLVIPLGDGPDCLLLLEEPSEQAPASQDLLRLADSLRAVVWHRLQETTERQRLRDELQRLRFHGSATHNALLASTRLQDVRQALRESSGSGDPVLLLGEEGTELEDLARYMHAESPRRQQPFVPWNAVRVPEWRHEKDLFGDGRKHSGILQRARGGTLFVDRFEWLSPELQTRLATAVTNTDAADSVAFVAAAASADSIADSSAGATWMTWMRFAVPPLRGHARDILSLAELFLSEMGTRPDGSARLLSERAKRLLVTHAWPGNVRELRLVLESAAAQALDQPIMPRHLPTALCDEAGTTGSPPIPTLEEMERQHIRDVMQSTGGNRSRAAQLLGIATSTLYEKLKKFQIDV